jgi:hypothetical protein
MMKLVTVESSFISRFRETWPCLGVPYQVTHIEVAFDSDGDLIDYDMYENDQIVECWESEDGRGHLLSDARDQSTEIYWGHNVIGPNQWVAK